MTVVPEWAQRVLEALAQPAFLTDGEGRVVGTNRAYRAAASDLRPDASLLDALDLAEPERTAMASHWTQALDSAVPFTHTLEAGSRWRRWSAGPTGGTWLHTLETHLPEAGDALALFTEAFDQAPVGFALFDTDARYMYVNRALATMNGVRAHDHLGRLVSDLLPNIPLDVERGLQDTIRTGARVPPVEVMGETPARPGEQRVWMVNQYPLRSRTGRVLGAAALALEITEARRAERALQEQTRVLREQSDLLTLANETVILRDPESRVVGWNHAAVHMYGYPVGEALGRVTHDLLHTQFPISREAVDDALATVGFWEGELTHRRRDGTPIVVLSRQATRRDERGQLRAILEVNWDITARKGAEQRLADFARTLERRVDERTAQLTAANEELEAFAYTVAHDLRAPLRSINGFANAVLEDYGDTLDDDGRSMLRRIEHNAGRMDELIRDLLAYSHISRSALEVRRVPLGEVLARALADLQLEIEARHAQVTVTEPLPLVLAHETTLRQVLMNLLGNALKFVVPGVQPQVRVWSETRDDHTRVWVEDNGIGVEARHAQRIFRVFERLHTVEQYPGTGVGLAIVQKGLERMNGRVGLAAGAGGGSRFWFELPLAGSAA